MENGSMELTDNEVYLPSTLIIHEVEMEQETYFAYKGIIIQYERMQEKLSNKWMRTCGQRSTA
jgi:hypothetical protein